MTDGMIIAGIGLIGGLIAIVTPIIKLNGNIVRLTVSVDALKDQYEKDHLALADRVTAHGKQIDQLEKTVVRHDERITGLEGRKRGGN